MQRKSCRELRALLESFSDDLIMTSTDGFVGWGALPSPLCRHAVESVKNVSRAGSTPGSGNGCRLAGTLAAAPSAAHPAPIL